MKRIVIVDIDGTISKVGERLKHIQKEPPDWDSFYNDCFDDKPISDIVHLVSSFMQGFYRVIFCTGRRESVRYQTAKWLRINGLNDYDNLLMRKNGDFRHDTEVKPELLGDIYTTENVAFILEDRNSMVKKWRELGFICLQVAEGDF